MPYELLPACPVCQSNLSVTSLSCARCGTTVQGDFDAGAFSRLTAAQKQFAVSFLKCRGNIRVMEREYAISYPTVRTRIDEIVAALGESPATVEDDGGEIGGGTGETAVGPNANEANAPREARPATRRAILEMLSRGEINAETAQRMITAL